MPTSTIVSPCHVPPHHSPDETGASDRSRRNSDSSYASYQFAGLARRRTVATTVLIQ